MAAAKPVDVWLQDPAVPQPTKDKLREIRGLNNVYHNNGIQTWWVRADGEVENVEIA